MRTTRTRRALAGTALATLALAGGIAVSQASASAHEGHAPVAAPAAPTAPADLTGAQRQVIREATRRFADVDVAIAAGYLPTDECAEAPGLGAMGYHYVNPQLIGDGRIDPTQPEILLFAPTEKGPKLVGVEYMAVDADGSLETDDDRPTMLGHGLEGPMPGHEPGMPVHYDLHAWVFTHNPNGELATWNPAITCPQS